MRILLWRILLGGSCYEDLVGVNKINVTTKMSKGNILCMICCNLIVSCEDLVMRILLGGSCYGGSCYEDLVMRILFGGSCYEGSC